MSTRDQLRRDNRALRVRNAELEAQLDRTQTLVESVDGDRESANDTNALKDAVAALVNSQKAIMEMMSVRDTHKRKVYVDKPDKFDGKVGDYIETWIEQFETWFSHREHIEGMVEDPERIDTAIQTTAGDISHQLRRH
jgi:hypothetical protein